MKPGPINLAYVVKSFLVFFSRGIARAMYSLKLRDVEFKSCWLGAGVIDCLVRELRSPRDRMAAEKWVVVLSPGCAWSLVSAPFTTSADGLPLFLSGIVVRERGRRVIVPVAFGVLPAVCILLYWLLLWCMVASVKRRRQAWPC